MTERFCARALQRAAPARRLRGGAFISLIKQCKYGHLRKERNKVNIGLLSPRCCHPAEISQHSPMDLSLGSYAIIPSKDFDAREVGQLSSVAERLGCSVVVPGEDGVRVRVTTEAESTHDVVVAMRSARVYTVAVLEAFDGTLASGSTAVASCPSPPAVRAVAVIARCSNQKSVQVISSCGVGASVVVVVSIEWLFHCCVASTLRSPFLYALPPLPLPLSSVHATSSGITNAQRELLIPTLLSLGATFSPNLDERCTHIIVPSVGSGDFASSSKVVACKREPLCQYVWVVTSAWLAASQAQGCRAAERHYQPSGMMPPTFPAAHSWLSSISHNQQPGQRHVSQYAPLVMLPPSSLFLDDEPDQNDAVQPVPAKHQPQRPDTQILPSKTRGWWVDESSAAHITHACSPLPYLHVAELMSLSSSDPQPCSPHAAPLPSSQEHFPFEAVEYDAHASPPGVKAASQSPASSLSASRTSQAKRKDSRSASDDVIAEAEDVYCAVASLIDERVVRQGDCSFSEFHVKWLEDDSDSWVPECDIDPELVAAYRSQLRDHPLPSSSPCMASAAAAAAATGSSTLSSSSATKSSTSCTFSAGRGMALKSAKSSMPPREHVSFCSQLTPVALERPSQANDCFLSPVVNGSLLAAVTPANVIGSSGTSAMATSSIFCSPARVTDALVELNSEHSSCRSQSQLNLGASSVTSTQQPSLHTTPAASQKSSLSVEFPPSFAYRLSQQEPAPPVSRQHVQDVMDIGDYCVGLLPSLCFGGVLEPPHTLTSRTQPSHTSDIPIMTSASAAETPLSRPEEAVLPANTAAEGASMEDAHALDGSARKRRRMVASRNLGRIIVSLMSKDDAMYSNAYLSSLGACLSDVNCGAFDILVIDNLRASKKLLCALAAGKWVVSPDYLHASKRQGVLVQPDQYEHCEGQQVQQRAQNQQRKQRKVEVPQTESVVEQMVQVSPSAPRYWRQQMLRAFDGLLVCVDVDVLPSRAIMTSLLICGGATVADSLQRMHQLSRNNRVGFVVRPGACAVEYHGRGGDGDAAVLARFTVVADMDILMGLCQPLQCRLPFAP